MLLEQGRGLGSLSTAGPPGSCPLPGGSSGAVVNVSPWARGRLCWSCSARSRGSPAWPGLSGALTLPTLLTHAHGAGASAGLCWAQHNVLAFLLLLSQGLPQLLYLALGCVLISTAAPARALGSSWELLSCIIAFLTHRLYRSIGRDLGSAARSLWLCCCSPDLSPTDFPPAAPGKAPG